jgi:hypothetical protein
VNRRIAVSPLVSHSLWARPAASRSLCPICCMGAARCVGPPGDTFFHNLFQILLILKLRWIKTGNIMHRRLQMVLPKTTAVFNSEWMHRWIAVGHTMFPKLLLFSQWFDESPLVILCFRNYSTDATGLLVLRCHRPSPRMLRGSLYCEATGRAHGCYGAPCIARPQAEPTDATGLLVNYVCAACVLQLLLTVNWQNPLVHTVSSKAIQGNHNEVYREAVAYLGNLLLLLINSELTKPVGPYSIFEIWCF